MKVQTLLSDRSKWTQNAEARDSTGNTLDANDPGAVCWCVSGAIRYCYGDVKQRAMARQKLYDVVRKKFPHGDYVGVNDSKGYDVIYSMIVEAGI